MARTKKKKRFDFSDCNLLTDEYALFRERNSIAAICDMAQAALDAEYPEVASRAAYHYINRKTNIDDIRTKGTINTSNYYERRMMESAFASSPVHKDEQTAAFLQWYDGNAEAQEVYRATVKDHNWWWVEHGQVSNIEARANGWYERPRNLYMFTGNVYGWKGTQYMELNREQVYMEGDIVVLRSPYYRNWRYDPHYNNSNYNEDTPRYATVVAANTNKLAAGRRGRGSRAISVIWFEKDGSITEIGEKYIKLHDRKGRAAQMKARFGDNE